MASNSDRHDWAVEGADWQPRLERALRQAASASDDSALEEATRLVAALGRDLAERLALLAPALRSTSPGDERLELVQRIRALVKG